MTTEPTPAQDLRSALEPCPFCGAPLTVRGGTANPYGRCDTEDCWSHERKIAVPLHDPRQVEQFNRRAALTQPAENAKGGEVVAWMPIDTAPQDGSPIFVKGRDWGHKNGRIHYNMAVWENGQWRSADDDEQELAYLTDWLGNAHPPAADPVGLREENERLDNRETELMGQLSGLDQMNIILADLVRRAMRLIPEGKSLWWDEAKGALDMVNKDAALATPARTDERPSLPADCSGALPIQHTLQTIRQSTAQTDDAAQPSGDVAAMRDRIAHLEDENARLSKHVMSGVLGDLLNDDEATALADFVKHIRAPAAEERAASVGREPCPSTFGREHDEAFAWITTNCMAIRRDNGDMDYSLGAMVKAYGAGKAASLSPAAHSDVREALSNNGDNDLYKKLRQKLSRVHPSNQSPNLPLRVELTFGEIARLSTAILALSTPPAALDEGEGK